MKTSVAMCTYNGEKFLREQVNSILNQTVAVDEIVVCDDGSTDKTVEILKDYEQRFPGIFRIFINQKNLKSVKNFEKAISLCENEIIFLSDQDDVWMPEKVEEITQYFSQNPNIEVVATNGFGIDENGKELAKISVWEIPKLLQDKGYNIDYFKILAFSGNIATGASMAFRKYIVDEILPFPDSDQFHHDELIALNSTLKKSFCLLQIKLFKYRIHKDQQVGSVFFGQDEMEHIIKIYDYLAFDKNFTLYKKALKRFSEFQIKDKILSENKNYNQLRHIIRNEAWQLYQANKEAMLNQYPIKGRILLLTDKILNKRQFNEND